MDRFDESAAFWTAVTGTSLSARRGEHGEFATLLPPTGDAFLKLQGVSDEPGAHLDFEVEDILTAVQSAGDLGAKVIHQEPGLTVMQSPAGRLFCVVPWTGLDSRPTAVTGPPGSVSLVDQVCIDIGPTAYDDEVAFWTGLTGWHLRETRIPEFKRLCPPSSLPVQLLLQRLDEDRPASAHIDFACSDVSVIRDWHVQHGAAVLHITENWTVMRDPSGGTYCLTVRHPRGGPSE